MKRGFIAYANSEGSGEPAHSSSLARAFAICLHNIGKSDSGIVSFFVSSECFESYVIK